MASDDHAPGFEPGNGYTQEDWDDVCDSPESTEEEQAQARPMAEALPELAAAMRRKRGTPKVATKDLVSLRLDKDVLAALRAGGSGWQGRVNATLRASLGLPDVAGVAATVHTAVGRRISTRETVKVHTVVETREVSDGVTLEMETVRIDRQVPDRSIASGVPGGEVHEDMDVVGSDGVLVGTVAAVDGRRLEVRAAGATAGGQHHYLPWSAVGSVTDRVTLAVTAGEAEARSAIP